MSNLTCRDEGLGYVCFGVSGKKAIIVAFAPQGPTPVKKVAALVERLKDLGVRGLLSMPRGRIIALIQRYGLRPIALVRGQGYDVTLTLALVASRLRAPPVASPSSSSGKAGTRPSVRGKRPVAAEG